MVLCICACATRLLAGWVGLSPAVSLVLNFVKLTLSEWSNVALALGLALMF